MVFKINICMKCGNTFVSKKCPSCESTFFRTEDLFTIDDFKVVIRQEEQQIKEANAVLEKPLEIIGTKGIKFIANSYDDLKTKMSANDLSSYFDEVKKAIMNNELPYEFGNRITGHVTVDIKHEEKE